MSKWFGLLRAEWLKIVRNYRFNAFLVWILPIGMFAFYCIMIIGGLLLKAPSEELIYGCDSQWTSNIYDIWNFLSAFPGSIFGRILPIAFFTVVFAGEYQWGTWKNIIPLSQRVALLISKAIASLLTVVSSILLTAPISAGGQALLCKIGGASYGPSLSAQVLKDFIGDFLLSSLIGVLVLMMVLAFSALASIMTRSILGGFLGGFGLSLLELFLLGILILFGNIFQNPSIVNLYRFTPGFNLENLRLIFFQGTPFRGELLGLNAEHTIAGSLAVMAAWILIPALIAAWKFIKQDITQ
jgi:hypothetical protein